MAEISLAAAAAAQWSQNKPHIVFTLVDDWGFAEAGFRNPAVKTPNFDHRYFTRKVSML